MNATCTEISQEMARTEQRRGSSVERLARVLPHSAKVVFFAFQAPLEGASKRVEALAPGLDVGHALRGRRPRRVDAVNLDTVAR